MSMHRLYIENPLEHALVQLEAYGRMIGLETAPRLVLRDCVAEAWDDGHAQVNLAAFATTLGISVGAVFAALRKLAERDVVELNESADGSLVVRPLLLASESGSLAGVGWWQRVELQDGI